ncbi:Uncharacterised protein [Mycobacterium tuberculosis]|nr:Uncharacterised protein [Mycobacterium tuberculosis]
MLPHSRDRVSTIASPDTSMPFFGDASRSAGALLPSDTAMVAVAPSVSMRITGSLPVCSKTFSTNTLTTTSATGMRPGSDQPVSHSRTSRRDSRRLVRFGGSLASARHTVRSPS